MGTHLTRAARALAGLGLTAGALVLTAPAASAAPTCADTLGVKVHGQHVLADYVTGLHGELVWPPAGQVGRAVAGKGAAVPGGPGPGFHFPNGFAPGASFCTGSSSPGLHP
ncbi:hypothetical protein [Ornithinimicrobium tianjinense]|uniref:Uncharacterized protein n=1 Tax=Ornithinimicrobium tianjinense TaxID=1195761 RepID=A0A917BE45_9MICO|nr:hypothetical protein [Ornithinimicrobium tianjinense]GGF39658.1 hypothetical protein GCM10011366_04100 [Ornithinimicrobium tianjinense]